MMMNINLKREKEIYRELEKRNNKDNKNLQLKKTNYRPRQNNIDKPETGFKKQTSDK